MLVIAIVSLCSLVVVLLVVNLGVVDLLVVVDSSMLNKNVVLVVLDM
jgi:hypothetical protein